MQQAVIIFTYFYSIFEILKQNKVFGKPWKNMYFMFQFASVPGLSKAPWSVWAEQRFLLRLFSEMGTT